MSIKKIKINKRNVADIHYRKDDSSIDKLIQTVKKEYPRIEKYYGFKIPKVVCRVVYSRQDIDKLFKTKTSPWVVGIARRNNRVYFLSPSKCKECSNHKPSDMDKVLLHEIAHIFNYKVNQYPAPWLNEGLAMHLAKQKKGPIKKENWDYFKRRNFICNTKFNWMKAAPRHGYSSAYWFLKFLMQKYDKEMLIKFLQVNPKKGKPFIQFRKLLGHSNHELEKGFEKYLEVNKKII